LIKNSHQFEKKCQKTAGRIFWTYTVVLPCSAQFNPAVLVGHCSVFVFISAYL